MKGNAVRRYEGLFILNTAGKEEGVKDMIDKISNEITATGGRIETVQKMDKKNFARVSDKKYTGAAKRRLDLEAICGGKVDLSRPVSLSSFQLSHR